MKHQSKHKWVISTLFAACAALSWSSASAASAEEGGSQEVLSLYCPGQEHYIDCWENVEDCNDATYGNGIEDGCQYGSAIGGNVCPKDLPIVRYTCP